MELKQARVLVDSIINGVDCKANQVVEGEASIIKSAVKDGVLDDAKAAIDYALSIDNGILQISIAEQTGDTEE